MKQFLIFILCVGSLTCLHAQFSFGPKAGLNVSEISFSKTEFSASMRPNFYAGAFANYHLTSEWAGQFEVLYSLEGGNEKAVSSGTTGHISAAYIQFPLLAQYHTKFGFFAETGPQLGLLSTIKETFAGKTNDIKQYYKTTDFRWPVGVGYEFNDKTLKGLGVNLRYSFSFSKINKVDVGGQSLKNKVISLGVFYKIPAFKK